MFGVRALESGVAVDGVWVSRPATPELPSQNSRKSSWTDDSSSERSHGTMLFEKHLETHLIAPSSAHDFELDSKETQSKIRVDRKGLTELPRPVINRHSLIPDQAKRQSRCLVPWNSDYGYKNGLPGTSTDLTAPSTVDRPSATHQAIGAYRYSGLNNLASARGVSFDRSGTNVKANDANIASVHPLLRTGPGPRRLTVDIAMLDNHRILQAAETGQLTPRSRRFAASADLTGFNRDLGVSRAPIDYFDIPRERPSAESIPTMVQRLPPALLKISMPDVTPFTQFVQNAPPSPRSISVSSQSSNGRNTTDVLRRTSDDSSSIAPASTRSPSPPQTAPIEQTQLPLPSCRQSFDRNRRRHSDIIRGHGTGFEILKPGSLPIQIPAQDRSERQRMSRPPVSLQNFVRTRSRSRSTSSTGRKLQKKRQSFHSTSSSSS